MLYINYVNTILSHPDHRNTQQNYCYFLNWQNGFNYLLHRALAVNYVSVFRSNLFETYLKLMYILFEYYFSFGGN